MPANPNGTIGSRLLLVAFEGWNDAGEAATGAVKAVSDRLDLIEHTTVDPELYFDYQFSRPTIAFDERGRRSLTWPGATVWAPAPLSVPVDDAEKPERVSGVGADGLHILIGTEPARSWKAFAAELIDSALSAGVDAIVFLGAMLADAPHTRPLSVYVTSDNDEMRSALDIDRPSYEGPVGILSVLADAAETAGIPTLSLWASVPHYVHNAPSPKAVLSLVRKLEELTGLSIPVGDLEADAAAWEAGVDALAAEDEDMASYIEGLEQARDTVDAPEASGEAIAEEFERYLRKRGDDKGDEPRHPRS